VEHAHDVADEVQQRVRGDRLGPLSLAVATLIRRDGVIPRLGQRDELMSPRVPGLRKAVAEHDERPVARLGDVDANAVGLDGAVADLGAHARRFGGCAFTAASLTSVPQPGPVGKTRCPFTILGTVVTSSSYQGTTSGSISMIRRFGTIAQKCAFMHVDSQP